MTADSRKYDQSSRSWQMQVDGAGLKWERVYDLAHPLQSAWRGIRIIQRSPSR
jgi:hypothetical protein